MRNVRALNISNSYRSANINTRVRKQPNQIMDYRNLNASKFHQLYEDNQKLKKQNLSSSRVFIGHHRKGEDMPRERQIALDGFPFWYLSDEDFPLPLLLACNDNKNAMVFYKYHGYINDRSLSALFRASMVCRLGIRVPIIIGVTDLLGLMVHLYDAKFTAERVELDFVGLTKKQLSLLDKDSQSNYTIHIGDKYYPSTKIRLVCYSKLHEVLARWCFQLFIICETQRQADYIKKKGLKIANK